MRPLKCPLQGPHSCDPGLKALLQCHFRVLGMVGHRGFTIVLNKIQLKRGAEEIGMSRISPFFGELSALRCLIAGPWLT